MQAFTSHSILEKMMEHRIPYEQLAVHHTLSCPFSLKDLHAFQAHQTN